MRLSGDITLEKGREGGDEVSALSFDNDKDCLVFTSPSVLRNSNATRSSTNSRSGGALLPRSSQKASEKARIQETQESFSLCQLRVDELPLFGREEQLKQLNSAFIRSTTENGRGLVLIRGNSGVGKTSLTQDASLKKLLRSQRGIFALGKYELQQAGDEPYSGVLDVLKLVCDKILKLPTQKSDANVASSSDANTCSHPEVHVKDVQEKLEEIDNVEWQLLVDAVPGLERLMLGLTNQTVGPVPQDEKC